MSDVQARREARRRKILLNAESRLKKITTRDDIGFEERLEVNSGPSKATLPSQEPSQKAKISQTDPAKSTQDSQTNHAERRVTFEPESDLRTIYQNPVADDNDSVSELEFTNFEERKSEIREWIIVILALLMRYLFFLSEQYPELIHTNFLVKYHVNKIFIPFFIYEITEYVFFRPFTPQRGLLNMLFMLNLGMRPENLHKIVIISRVMLRIIQDMMIYFFAFVCIDQLISFVTGEHN